MDSSYHIVPYAVYPDSGNEYPVSMCSSINTCSCGCGRNLAELFVQQNKNISKRTVYVNNTKVKRRSS